MKDNRLLKTFISDTGMHINKINDLLIAMENNTSAPEAVNELFRYVHSIKSEAAYLGIDDISETAHDLENILETVRSSSTRRIEEKELIMFCYKAVDRISEQLKRVKVSAVGTLNNVSSEEEKKYTDFEKLLLREAEDRDEKLYEVCFGISEEESMKYARAYLALSNLEMKYNVIKTIPELDENEENFPEAIIVVLSSGSDEQEIIRDLNIDQISNLRIKRLIFSDEYDARLVSEAAADLGKSKDNIYNVDASEIDEINDYLVEIRRRISGLSGSFGDSSELDSMENELKGLESISSGIASLMDRLKMVQFADHFASYRRLVRDLADKSGKKIELFIEGDLKISRDFAEYLKEPIIQILKNAIVHGIEAPEMRSRKGKSPTGKITLAVRKNSESTVITVSDDGAGIDENIYSSNGIGRSEHADVLNIISQPGFSSLAESNKLGGRGVGLDLVVHELEKKKGRLELVNNPGQGCIFRMVFSDFQNETKYLVLKYRDNNYAVEMKPGIEPETYNPAAVTENGINFEIDGIGLYSPEGRVSNNDSEASGCNTMLYIKNPSGEGYVVFEEALFEVKYDKKRIVKTEPAGKNSSWVKVDSQPADFLLLEMKF